MRELSLSFQWIEMRRDGLSEFRETESSQLRKQMIHIQRQFKKLGEWRNRRLTIGNGRQK